MVTVAAASRSSSVIWTSAIMRTGNGSAKRRAMATQYSEGEPRRGNAQERTTDHADSDVNERLWLRATIGSASPRELEPTGECARRSERAFPADAGTAVRAR